MSKKQEIIDELKEIYDGEPWHADNLMEILDGISAEQAGKRPVPEAHSVWELVGHIAGWNDVWATRLGGKDILDPPGGDFPVSGADDEAWNGALSELERSHRDLISKIETVRDEDMSREFLTKGYTLAFFLEGIVRHNVYHAGQIAILKKGLLQD